MGALRIVIVLGVILLHPLSFGQFQLTIHDSIKKNISSEIDFVENTIEDFQGDVYSLVNLKCYLCKLYNRAGLYQEAAELADQFSKEEYEAAKGEVSLTKAISFKYQNEPEKAKFLFDRALIHFIMEDKYCMQIEVRIELMEYYRKFDLLDLAIKEANELERLLKIYKGCRPELGIRYLNRFAAVQNIYDSPACIQTSYRAIDSCKKYNEEYYMAVSYNEIAYAYQHVKELDSADYYYRMAEDVFMSRGLLSDLLHVKMNRLRMYAHNGINRSEIVPGLLEIERIALADLPTYDLSECYKTLWAESHMNQEWELAFIYVRKYHYLEVGRLHQNISERIEIVKQQEMESQTKLQNLVLSNRVEKQNFEIEQKRTTIWLAVLGLIVLTAVLVFLFRILGQRNKLTEDLRVRNIQKDQLIQEVHHRVKNNLNFVSSLLEMQISSLPEETKTDELRNASVRIESMSLVHQMLYNQDDIATVDLNVYLPELISYLKDSLMTEQPVEIRLSCEEIHVESRGATAIGLIVTEFITNSYKHAFKGIEHPTIDISFKLTNKKLIAVLKDNGIGMINQKSGSKKGFGMRIIDIFSRQINAEIGFSFHPGTQLTLTMNYDR